MPRGVDTLLLVILESVALLGLVGAWYGVSGTSSFTEQIAPLSLGVASLAFAGMGNALYLIAQRRTLAELLVRVTADGAEELP